MAAVTGEVRTRSCANPRCVNVIVSRAQRGPARKYCSKKCANVVSWARYTGREVTPPVIVTRMGQLCAYCDLLLRLAEKAEDRQRQGLFDRIERTLAEIDAEAARQHRVPARCGTGWPS